MGADTSLQAHKKDKHLPETAGTTNTRDNQMVKGKHRNITNRNQGNMAPFKSNCPTTASPGYPNTPEKQDLDLRSHLMILNENFKKDINHSLKEIQVEALKEETQKSLKELQEISNKQVKELNKTIQNLLCS